jgi:hypothetical protein
MKLTKINEKRLKEIFQVLFPEYKSIKVYSNGLIVMRRNRWSRDVIINTLEGFVFHEIPSKLNKYLGYEQYIPIINNNNFLVEYLFELILRKPSYNDNDTQLDITINSIIRDWRKSYLINNGDVKQTIKLFRLTENNKKKSKFRLRGFSLLKK